MKIFKYVILYTTVGFLVKFLTKGVYFHKFLFHYTFPLMEITEGYDDPMACRHYSRRGQGAQNLTAKAIAQD